MPSEERPAADGPFVMIGDAAAQCVDGVCAIPPAPDREHPRPPEWPADLGRPA